VKSWHDIGLRGTDSHDYPVVLFSGGRFPGGMRLIEITPEIITLRPRALRETDEPHGS